MHIWRRSASDCWRESASWRLESLAGKFQPFLLHKGIVNSPHNSKTNDLLTTERNTGLKCHIFWTDTRNPISGIGSVIRGALLLIQREGLARKVDLSSVLQHLLRNRTVRQNVQQVRFRGEIVSKNCKQIKSAILNWIVLIKSPWKLSSSSIQEVRQRFLTNFQLLLNTFKPL